MVMEFIEGETLQQMIARRGPIPAEMAIPLFKQALLGVGAAHKRGIVHRDIKPANIMVNTDGLIKVMDFGIAKVLGVTGTTRTNLQMGTAWYMAPEQVLSRPVDARTDIYALGVTLYELLSGQVPFRADSEYEVLSSHVQRVPELPTLHYPHIPQRCVDAVMRALSKEPEKRFASTDEFSAALDQTAMAPTVPVEVAAAVTLPPSAVPPPPPGKPQAPFLTVPVESFSPQPPGDGMRPQPPHEGARPGPLLPVGEVAGKKRSAWPILAAVIVLICGAAALIMYALHERENRAAMQATAGQVPTIVQQTSAPADDGRRTQSEQDQSDEELKRQLAEEQSRTSPPPSAPRQAATPPKTAPTPVSPAQNPPVHSPPDPARPLSPQPGGDEIQRLRMLTGTWSGSYTCGQGTTGATLQIVANSDQNVGALFQFAVPNSSPGSYFLRGAFDPTTNRVAMRFTSWKYQPQGYTPGNISGTVNFNTNELRGIVVLPGCAALSMRKQ